MNYKPYLIHNFSEERKIELSTNRAPVHYYGDITRKLFIIAGVIILLGVPVFTEFVPRPFIDSVLVAVIFALVAGFINPESLIAAYLHMAFSAGAVIIFETFAIYFYLLSGTYGDPFMLVSQTLAVIFFISLYYSAKTVRGMILHRNGNLKIEAVLTKYGKHREDLKEIFWNIISGGADEEIAAKVITSAEYLQRYLFMLNQGMGAIVAARKVLKII